MNSQPHASSPEAQEDSSEGDPSSSTASDSSSSSPETVSTISPEAREDSFAGALPPSSGTGAATGAPSSSPEDVGSRNLPYKLDSTPLSDEGNHRVFLATLLNGSTGTSRIAVKVFPLPKNEAHRLTAVRKATDEFAKRRCLGDHPHLAKSLGIYEENSQIHLTMEYAPGLSAQNWLDGGWHASSTSLSSSNSSSSASPSSPAFAAASADANAASSASQPRLYTSAETTTLAYILARALSHMHDPHAFYHFDVKPSNILFFDATSHTRPDVYSARLSDFGTAKVARDVGLTMSKSRDNKGEGTEGFMAPERLLRLPGKDKADVWSFGATLVALLTNHVLGMDESLVETWTEALHASGSADWKKEEAFDVEGPLDCFPLPRAKEAWRATTPDLRNLIISCLALRPENRPSMAKFLALPLLVTEAARVNTHAAVTAAVKERDNEIVVLRRKLVQAEERGEALLLCKEAEAAAVLLRMEEQKKIELDAFSKILEEKTKCIAALTGTVEAKNIEVTTLSAAIKGAEEQLAKATPEVSKDLMDALLAVMRQGDVSFIRYCLMTHPKSSAVYERACEICYGMTGKLSEKWYNNQVYAQPENLDSAKSGVVSTVSGLLITCLTNWSSSAPVCQKACLAFTAIAFWASGNYYDGIPGITHLLSCGAIPFITTCLKNHAAAPTVCEAACTALQGISRSTRGQGALIAADAISLIIASLKTHAASAAVCQPACAALCSMAQASAGKDALIAAGVAPLLFDCMKNHFGKSNGVCGEACGALYYLATTSAGKDACNACIDAGSVHLIVSISRTPGINGHASNLLSTLGYSGDGSKR